jgi:putative proteasome-type protease
VTYGLAISTASGLVLASDSRTSAGVDYVNSVRKLHIVPNVGDDRAIAILTAGSLATTQQVLHTLEREIAIGADPSLATVADLWDAALHVGTISRAVQSEHRESLARTGADGSASFIVAGAIGNTHPSAHLVYPEGNTIATTDVLCFVQIGDTKYGKPVLDRLAGFDLDLASASLLAGVSIDEAVRANVSVGYPVDIATLAPGDREFRHVVLEEYDDVVVRVRRQWHDAIVDGFAAVDRPTLLRGDPAVVTSA